MDNKYNDFQDKRMYIFGELVKRYWNGELNDSTDLEELAIDIKIQLGFDDNDLSFIKDHIRISMGLDPRGNQNFDNEIDLIKKSGSVGLPVIAKIDEVCKKCNKKNCLCDKTKYESDIYRKQDEPIIIDNKCISCGECIPTCDFGAIADKIEFLPVIDLLKSNENPIFAVVAPSIAGQFGENVQLGQLRTAFKIMGFTDMIEVAMFADILTICEALEFNHKVKTEQDFFLTSCCCPVWFNLVKKSYPKLYDRMSPSVSPMIASGRILKELYEGAKVVFFAPCIAKKAEMKEPDLAGSIDFVINFRELSEIFHALKIDPSTLPADEKDQASYCGRIYARTGGVSFSVKSVINRLEPTRLIKLKSRKVDGVKNCKSVLDSLKTDSDEPLKYNFVEGMGCVGGCVGGPRTILDVESATKAANDIGEESIIMTPFDNVNVMKILKQLGINSIEELLTDEKTKKLLIREKN